jgi:protein gp37
MELSWAIRLYKMFREQGKPFFFKQTTAKKPGQGEDALGKIIQEFPVVDGTWAQ